MPQNYPSFKQWKGEEANEALKIMWEVSNGDKDFILTMGAENGEFTPYRLHPKRNKDGSWDYSFGLNSYYHKDMIARIKAKTVSVKEIIEYTYKVYQKRHGAFYGYNVRSKTYKIINFQ